MSWNWQREDWPRFSWPAARLAAAERLFLVDGGVLLGSVRHMDTDAKAALAVEAMGEEAVTSSEIEGELLDRDSVQSSIRRGLGLTTAERRVSAAEAGIAELMVDLHQSFDRPLDQDTLFTWHRKLMQGRTDLHDLGRYRTHGDPMQVVSGRIDAPTVHFEAPPASRVPEEMSRFLDWFERSGPSGTDPLPALTRAGVAHLYFESIHPFEDGNGRIGRAISEKALSQSLGQPSLTALAATLLLRRSAYYSMLEASNKQNEIGEWLAWFAGIVLEAQQRSRARVEFLLDKTRLLDQLRDALNERQRKVLLRVLREGPEGFAGGLSAGNYVTIAKTSPATARRDLADLVEKGALTRTGERRYARYHPTLPLRPVSAVTIDANGNVLTG